MNVRGYLVISAVIFALAAIAHIVRLINGWTLQIGPYAIPSQQSRVGLAIGRDPVHLGIRLVTALSR